VAGNEVVGLDLLEGGSFLGAALHALGAAAVEGASGGGIHGGGEVALEDHALLLGSDLGYGHCGEQSTGVGMELVVVQLAFIGQLDQLAQIHNADTVGNVTDNAQVMGDEEVSKAEVILQLGEQVEDLGLNGNVKGGNGFVADDELGVHGQGTGDSDTLTLAAGELVGVAVGVEGSETDHAQQLGGTLFDLLFGSHLMGQHGLLKHGTNGHTGVKGSVGILENDLHLAADFAHLGTVQLAEILTVEDNFTGGGLDELKNGLTEGGLTASGFADETKGLTAVDEKAYIVNCLDVGLNAGEKALGHREILTYIISNKDLIFGHYLAPPLFMRG